jgi:RNA polymerase sigma-70 factor (ECF subfamily)
MLDPRVGVPASTGIGRVGDSALTVGIPEGINSSSGESSPEGLARDTLEDRLEPNELERFEAVVLPHLNAAYGLARYLTRNDADAEDVVQEALLRALRHFGAFRGEAAGGSRAWVLAIVRNTAYTWRRRRRADDSTTEFDETIHSETAGGAHPESELARRESRESLAQAIDGLSPELREAIVLREVEGLSYKEIGDVMGVPIGTVMSRLSRARKRLQQALTPSRRE